MGQNVDHHDEEQNQQNHAVQRRRKQSAQNGHVFAALIGHFLHSIGRRQEAGELRGDQIAKIAAQSIGDNIIHIRQPVGSGIDEIQAAELGQLVKQAQGQRKNDGLFSAGLEKIPQIDAEGHGQQNVENNLEQRGIFENLFDRGEIGQIIFQFPKNVQQFVEGFQLKPWRGVFRHFLHRREGKDNEKIGAHHV